MKSKKSTDKLRGHNFDYVVVDEVVTLPDTLTQRRPYKNKNTGKIQYFSWWDLYVDRQKEIIALAILYGRYQYEQKHSAADWEEIPDTPMLRILYDAEKEE